MGLQENLRRTLVFSEALKTHYSELWLKESWKRWIGMEISHKIKFCYHVSFDDTPWFATVNNSILQF